MEQRRAEHDDRAAREREPLDVRQDLACGRPSALCHALGDEAGGGRGEAACGERREQGDPARQEDERAVRGHVHPLHDDEDRRVARDVAESHPRERPAGSASDVAASHLHLLHRQDGTGSLGFDLRVLVQPVRSSLWRTSCASSSRRFRRNGSRSSQRGSRGHRSVARLDDPTLESSAPEQLRGVARQPMAPGQKGFRARQVSGRADPVQVPAEAGGATPPGSSAAARR